MKKNSLWRCQHEPLCNHLSPDQEREHVEEAFDREERIGHELEPRLLN